MTENRAFSDFEARWRERFEEFAHAHDDDAGIAGWTPTGLDTRLRFFLRRAPRVTEHSCWLDAGCGAGTYSRYLASLGATVVGLDYSHATARKARSRSAGDCLWAVADVTRLPLRAAAFDGAICFGVTQALEQSDAAVRELAGSVRPGGEVWVDALNALCLPNLLRRMGRWLRGKPRHLRYESPRALCAAFREAGLIDLELAWMPILPGRFGRFQRWVETPLAKWLLRHVPGCGSFFCHAFMVKGRKPVS
ncbi:MAG: class I SAM-dependent methyltransferase [Pseudomonadota bacterium]